jgi:chorismate mutase
MYTLRALRGAVCSENNQEEIKKRTVELYDRLLKDNELAETELVSLFFSVTADLTALNPASALRKAGRAGEAAIMVFQEAEYIDSLAGTIRVLIHCYMDNQKPLRHVYCYGAEKLRPDRTFIGG